MDNLTETQGRSQSVGRTQLTSQLLMIRPLAFGFNSETSASNAFQKQSQPPPSHNLYATREFAQMVDRLRSFGVEVLVFDEADAGSTPDAVFSNNWITTHQNGKVVLYPMMADNRRRERRKDVVTSLKEAFQVEEVIDLAYFERKDKFLEGTGSLVLDRINHIAYATLSPRTFKEPLDAFSKLMDYQIVRFHSVDRKQMPIYHTNVMMGMGDRFAVICLESIVDPAERKLVIRNLEVSGKYIIDISQEQVSAFAGNVLQVKNKAGEKLLILSESAAAAFTEEQKARLHSYCDFLVPVDLSLIERVGGGSARCMITEVFLERKN